MFHLVQVEAMSKRCILQPILREFGFKHLTPYNKNAVRLRFAGYYACLAEENQDLNDAIQRIVLRTELHNLHSAAEYMCVLEIELTATSRCLINLGVRLQNLPVGVRLENLQQAIACYKGAMRVYTEADFPYEWAATQINLGAAYTELPSGNRGSNLQQAMPYYTAALRVYTEADFPHEWAAIQVNLGANSFGYPLATGGPICNVPLPAMKLPYVCTLKPTFRRSGP